MGGVYCFSTYEEKNPSGLSIFYTYTFTYLPLCYFSLHFYTYIPHINSKNFYLNQADIKALNKLKGLLKELGGANVTTKETIY